jgi:hypothetical protein
MRIRSWSILAFTLLALSQLSCATIGLTPVPESMPAARAGLLPEYRIFYDALQDYGDWTYIEPFGYVFRPYGNVEGWRPYQYGYWAPSDTYGWVWISAEPFGWATYHYGDWLYDRYQGWVWIPGLDWGPAWVSWEETPDYIGWAPMFPPGASPDLIPGGEYLYVPVAELPSADVGARVKTKVQVGDLLGTPRTIWNPVEHGGVKFDAGPKFAEIERRAGPLPRVKVEDLAPGTTPVAKPGARPGRPPAGTTPRPSAVPRPGVRPTPAGAPDETAAVEAMRRAAEEAARAAATVTGGSAAPPSNITVVRPGVRRGRAVPAEKPREGTPRERPRGHERAVADSTKAK